MRGQVQAMRVLEEAVGVLVKAMRMAIETMRVLLGAVRVILRPGDPCRGHKRAFLFHERAGKELFSGLRVLE